MILRALYDYYERRKDLPAYGTETKQIAFLIVIDWDGNFVRFEDRRSKESKHGQSFVVPKGVGRTSAVNPNYLWDNGKYVLGIKDAKAACLPAFKGKIMDASRQLPESRELKALNNFYSSKFETLLQQMEKDPLWPEVERGGGENFSFMIDGEVEIIAEKRHLFAYVPDDSSPKREGICLITGKKGELAELSSVTNLPGQVVGKLVAFQTGSGYDSYGKEKLFNAPISVDADFKYTTALRTMLSSGSRNKFSVGDRIFLFWASARDSEVEKKVEDAVYTTFGFSSPEQDDPDARLDAAKKVFRSISSGVLKTSKEDRFFILGVTPPNSARIAVVYWNECSLAEFAGNISKHFEDMEICDTRKEKHPYSGLRTMISSVTRVTRDGKMSDAQPNLSESIMKSIVQLLPYPFPLYRACIGRIRAESSEDRSSVTIARAAILKAYLNRLKNDNNNKNLNKMVDLENTNQGYLCGRLFAVLERIQESANNITTIRSRYMNAASATPAAVFPTIMNLSVHHAEKMNEGNQIWFDRLKAEIVGKIDSTGFPAHLSLQDQGRFFVGYYHQRQEFFTSKKRISDEATETENE